jgi:hypothetical protein
MAECTQHAHKRQAYGAPNACNEIFTNVSFLQRFTERIVNDYGGQRFAGDVGNNVIEVRCDRFSIAMRRQHQRQNECS